MKRLIKKTASFDLSSYEVGQVMTNEDMKDFDENHNPNGNGGREAAVVYFNGKLYSGDDHTPITFDIMDSEEFKNMFKSENINDLSGDAEELYLENKIIFYDHYKTDKGEHFFEIQGYSPGASSILQESIDTVVSQHNCPVFDYDKNSGYVRVA